MVKFRFSYQMGHKKLIYLFVSKRYFFNVVLTISFFFFFRTQIGEILSGAGNFDLFLAMKTDL